MQRQPQGNSGTGKCKITNRKSPGSAGILAGENATNNSPAGMPALPVFPPQIQSYHRFGLPPSAVVLNRRGKQKFWFMGRSPRKFLPRLAPLNVLVILILIVIVIVSGEWDYD